MPRTLSVADSVPRRPTRSRSPSFAFDEGSPVMHQSMRLATLAEGFGDAAHAVDGIALLVRGQQQRDGARMPRMRGDESFQRDHERGDAAFHVGGATPVQHAVADLGHERIARPALARTRRHHVGMAEQHQHRRACAVRRPQVVDVAVAQVFAAESGALQAFGDQRLAAAVVGRQRRPQQQFLGQLEDFPHHELRLCRLTSSVRGAHARRVTQSRSVA